MKVSLDGGVTYQDAPNGVRVVYEGIDVPAQEKARDGQVHFNFTDEGVITALAVRTLVIGSMSQTIAEVVEQAFVNKWS